MTKSDLILKLTEKNNFLFQKDIQKIIDVFFEALSESLENGKRVELRGFGAFGIKVREARIARNPRTGEPVAVPAKKMPFFKMGKKMRERMNK